LDSASNLLLFIFIYLFVFRHEVYSSNTHSLHNSDR